MMFSNFLKRVLILDAAGCLGMGAAAIAGQDLLAGPLGLSQGLLAGAGYLLVPIGLFIGWLGTRTSAPAALVWLVIVGNLLWTFESLVVAATAAGITGLGSLVVSGQGVAVLVLAGLEYVGLQRSRSATA